MKIKSILVSQPEPESDKNPYKGLSEKYGVKIDFRPFIKVEGVPLRDVRKERVSIPEHTAVIFTSKTSVDHFFRICEELKYSVPDEMKYFCVSESIAFYLQKYITYRKRKIFYGKQCFDDLVDYLNKHKTEKYFLPVSDVHKPEIPTKLTKMKIAFSKAVLYRTINSDLSDLKDVNYDILVFFSPTEIRSLVENFPEFKQDSTKIAAFGPITSKAVKDAGLRLDIKVPTPNAPSMAMALDQFIEKSNKKAN